jgi:hypothetical protein
MMVTSTLSRAMRSKGMTSGSGRVTTAFHTTAGQNRRTSTSRT